MLWCSYIQEVLLLLIWDNLGNGNVPIEDDDMFPCSHLAQFLTDVGFELGYVCSLHVTIIGLFKTVVKVFVGRERLTLLTIFGTSSNFF